MVVVEVVEVEVAVEVELGGMNLFCWRCHQMEKMCRCKERNHDGIKFHFLLTSRRHSFWGGNSFFSLSLTQTAFIIDITHYGS